MQPPKQSPKPPQGFERKLAHEGLRTLIESTCRECGVSRLVSMADGSLERWEKEHICMANGKSA
jgi:hypothetical protein